MQYEQIHVPTWKAEVDESQRSALLKEMQTSGTALNETKAEIYGNDDLAKEIGWLVHHFKFARGRLMTSKACVLWKPRFHRDGLISLWDLFQVASQDDESRLIDRCRDEVERRFFCSDALPEVLEGAQQITAAEEAHATSKFQFARVSPHEPIEPPTTGRRRSFEDHIPANEGCTARLSRLGVASRHATYTHLLLESVSNSLKA